MTWKLEFQKGSWHSDGGTIGSDQDGLFIHRRPARHRSRKSRLERKVVHRIQSLYAFSSFLLAHFLVQEIHKFHGRMSIATRDT